jgi:hypothetical protein
MKFKKLSVALAAAALLSVGTANAAVVNVGGVVWNTAGIFDFGATSSLLENVVTTAGGVLSGVGRIATINGSSNFCLAAQCELTFTFTGYTLDADYLPNPNFSFSGGEFEFYVSAQNSDFETGLGFADGTPWLSLKGANTNGGSGGSLTGNITDFTEITGTGVGFLDVVGGLAFSYFDTNTKGNGRDFLYTSSFQPISSGGSVGEFTHFGTADISGNSQVPEPGVLALLGLGLAGIGFARRNKKQA